MSYCESVERRLCEIRGQVLPSDVDGVAHDTYGGLRCGIEYF